MDEINLIAWWPLRLSPEEICDMLNTEHIQELLKTHSLRCRMYENNDKDELLSCFIVDPHKPHLYITGFEKYKAEYYVKCKIPDVLGWKEIFQSFDRPVVYPVLLKTADNKFGILHFKLVEYGKVDKLGTSYTGVNYPYPEKWVYPKNTHPMYIDGPEMKF